MKKYLGVDGGGTSTSFLLFDHDGKELDHLEFDSLHFMTVGFSNMKKGFEKVKDYFIEKGYKVEEFDIVMGLGGYGSDDQVRNQIDEVISTVFPQAKVMSDSQLAMIAALDGSKGVFLISGTGSIAMYNDGEKIHRQGGFGYQIGDEGSGFWIGKKILQLFSQQVDERIERTDVYDLTLKHFNITNPYGIIALLNENPNEYRFRVASLAKVFSKCKDPNIDLIFQEAGRELAAIANGFKIKEKTKIAFGGSVLTHNKIVREACISALNPYFEVYEGKNKVEYAVYILRNNKE